MNLDVPTLFVVIVLISALLAISIGLVGCRNFRDGTLYWAIGLALHSASYTLYSLRDTISAVASIVLANVLLSAALALFAEGIFQFQNRRPPRWLIWTPVAIVAAVFSLAIDAAKFRVVAGTVIFALQSALVLVALIQKRRETAGVSQYILASALALVLAMFLMRLLTVMGMSAAAISLTAPSSVQSLTFLSAIASLILFSIGFLMMTKEQADERNLLLAYQDELTRLSNRRSILGALAQHAALAARGSRPVTILMIDIDHFKRVNDTYGHLMGDEVLRMVANCIRARLRTQDLAGRYGGEEFLVILPNTGIDGGRHLAETLRQTVAAIPINSPGGQRLEVTISAGVHEASVAENPSVETLIGAADKALYRAKENGRNRVEAL